MGICASCLGLDRHPSHQRAETDALLDDEQDGYGTNVEQEEEPQQDEEEIRRERQTFEQISSRAADNMIDVLHADHVESGHLTPNLSFLSLRGLQGQRSKKRNEQQTDEELEQEWLRDINANDADNDFGLKGSYGGNLVLDLSRLRQDEQSNNRR